MTDRPETPPFGRPLYQLGRGPDQADWLVGPALGVLVGAYFAFKTSLLIGVIAGAVVALGMVLLTLASAGRDRRRGDGGGGDAGGGGEFDPSSTRHFDACHSHGTDGGGDGGDGGDGGGGD